MKIKSKLVRTYQGVKMTTPYVKYSFQDKRKRLTADVFQDNSGNYEMTINGQQIECCGGGELNDWIKDIGEEIANLTLLYTFLLTIKHERGTI